MWIHSDRPLRDHCERQSISEVLEAARPARLSSRSQHARPAPTPRQTTRPSDPSGKHPPHRGGGKSVSKSRLSYPEARSLELDGSARPAAGCNARALPLPWCRRPSSLPYSYLQRLAELLVARRCCCQRRRDRLALRKRSRSRISAGRASLAAAARVCMYVKGCWTPNRAGHPGLVTQRRDK